jgi:hypothetical protein
MGGFSILITYTIRKTPDIMMEVEYKITVLSCGVPPGSFEEAVKYVNSTAGSSKEPGQIEHRSQCDLAIIPYVTKTQSSWRSLRPNPHDRTDLFL